MIGAYFIIALLLSACGFLFIFIILFSQIRKRYLDRYNEVNNKAIQGEINSLIVQSNIGSMPESAFRFKLSTLARIKDRSSHLAQLMIDKLVALRKNVTGESALLLTKTYEDLGLDQLTMRKLRGISWKQKAKALKELQVLMPKGSETVFTKFLTHRNKHLRRQARLGLVQVSANPLAFLDSLKDPLVRWEQITIYHNLRSRPLYDIPDFSRWYGHTDPSVVSFAVEMSGYFGQIKNIPQMEALLSDAVDEVKRQIIITLQKLESEGSAQLVVEQVMESRNIAVLAACTDFLASLGDAHSIKALEQLLQSEDEAVRFMAMKALNKIGAAHDVPKTEECTSMLNHLTNPLLT